MAFQPDPKKGSPRVRNPKEVLRGKLMDYSCAACGRPGADGHHVLPRDKGGDDDARNIVTLCGSGTTGCHGAHHGTPYTVPSKRVGDPVERRDARWVNHRIGDYIDHERPDTINYLIEKLGDDQARVFLLDTYGLCVM